MARLLPLVLAKPGLKTTTACPVHERRTELATDPSVAPGRYHLLLAMTRLLPLVLAKPGLKMTMACPVHERLPK